MGRSVQTAEKLDFLIQSQKALASNKNPVRMQLDLFFDENSFVELGSFFNDQNENSAGVITGYGSINQRLVYAYAQDLSVMGGAFTKHQCEKICNLYDTALSTGAPIISILNSGDVRAEEGVSALVSFGKILSKIAQAKGVIPQIAIIAGKCNDAQAISASSSDFTFMVEEGTSFSLNTPESVQLTTGEVLDASAYANATKSGLVDFMCENLPECARNVAKLLAFLPMNYLDRPQKADEGDDFNRLSPELDNIIPDDYSETIEIQHILSTIVDNDTVFQISKDFAPNLITAFAHLGGISVGIVANNGEMDIPACTKAINFIKFCNSFNTPLISFVDAAGFKPSETEEHQGVARSAANLLATYNSSNIPKISVIIRKAYSSAYLAMGGKFTNADVALAWCTAEFALIPPNNAVDKLYYHVMQSAVNPQDARERILNDYRESFCSPYIGAENGQVDDIIMPSTTRPRLISTLEMLASKKR